MSCWHDQVCVCRDLSFVNGYINPCTWACAWVIMMCKHMSGYTQDTSLEFLYECVWVYYRKTVTNVCPLLFRKLICPRGQREGTSFSLPRDALKPLHRQHMNLLLQRPDSAIMNSVTPVIGHFCVPADHLSLGAAWSTWRPLPNPQHPMEMTHVALRQHKHKLVVQHNSLRVNMDVAKCGGKHKNRFWASDAHIVMVMM